MIGHSATFIDTKGQKIRVTSWGNQMSKELKDVLEKRLQINKYYNGPAGEDCRSLRCWINSIKELLEKVESNPSVYLTEIGALSLVALESWNRLSNVTTDHAKLWRDLAIAASKEPEACKMIMEDIECPRSTWLKIAIQFGTGIFDPDQQVKAAVQPTGLTAKEISEKLASKLEPTAHQNYVAALQLLDRLVNLPGILPQAKPVLLKVIDKQVSAYLALGDLKRRFPSWFEKE